MTTKIEAECNHPMTQGKPGQSGSWCVECGVKVLEVDARPCSDCIHHERLISGSICKKHLMAILPTMRVTYKISKGTCFESGQALDITKQ